MDTHRRKLSLIVIVLIVGVLACTLTNQVDNKFSGELKSAVVSVDIKASDGGEILHPAGARLIFEPGALSKDTTVTISNQGYSQPAETGSTPLINLSQDFEIDLGGAYIVGESLLELTFPEQTPFEIRTNHILLSHMDGNGYRRLRGGAIDENTRILSRNLGDLFETLSGKEDILHRAAITYIVPVTIPDQSVVSPPGSTPGITLVKLGSPPLVKQSNSQDLLQVPYYNQSGLSWCTPTSLAMLFNFHNNPFGLAANWEIAGGAGVDRDTGGKANWWVMSQLDIPRDRFEFLIWDDELLRWPQEGKKINDEGTWEPHEAEGKLADDLPIWHHFQTPFTSYIKYQIEGLSLREQLGEQFSIQIGVDSVMVEVPIVINDPRPVQVTSDPANHAFVIVGASDEKVWLHDSSGAVGKGELADEMSWEDFKDAAFKKGSASEEFRSIVIHAAAAPENQRRGSILLCDNANQCNNNITAASSLIYTDDKRSGNSSYWLWDGKPYQNGYFWDDDTNIFPDDPVFGNGFTLVENVFGTLTYDLLIANVTADTRNFTLRAILRDSAEAVLSEQIMQVSAAPYSWQNSEVQGTIDSSSLTEPGIYQILFQLEESGVQQDQKLVEFIVLVDEVPTNLSGDCLIGNWQVDNQSYLEFLQYVTEDASEDGDFVGVKGISGFILDSSGQMTSYSEDFSITLCTSQSCLTIPVNQSGTGSYEASADLLTVSGGSLVTADIYGTQGTATGEGGSARYTCTANTLVIEIDDLPPLTFHRVNN